ncbi:MAG: hypothetical protein HY690_16970 [Chloroflexi bacterium]|nr:hypothetical protein [Chloroflexota bacterium]
MRRFIPLLACLALLVALLPAPASAQQDPRFFLQTGFRISNDRFFEFFNLRGGINTFGFPVSRTVTFLGFTTQFFQRAIMQLGPDGNARLLNLLDPGLMPVTQVNLSTFPAPDPGLVAATPRVGEPDYETAIIDFVRQNAPDEFDGQPVNFLQTFLSTITCEVAFPSGDCAEGLLPLLALELWGAPTSGPGVDPRNPNFIYQRFQRGIMHFDATCPCTQGILLADYFKSVLTGRNLPLDLAAQVQGSPFFQQYNHALPIAVARPGELPATNLVNAFEPIPGVPFRTASPEYGAAVFLFNQPATTARDLGLLTGAHFQWAQVRFQWRDLEGAGKGQFTFDEADRVVRAARAAGVRLVARLDLQPLWSRADRTPANGPPDNPQDYADFVRVFVQRYSLDSSIGRVDAVQLWNEPNITREWGGQPPNPAQYVALLKPAFLAARQADPTVTVISAPATPTGVFDNTATPDDIWTNALYDNGAMGFFDVLGAHAPGYKAAPETSPEQVAADPSLGGHPSFAFRRFEQLRRIMEARGDADRQLWILEFGWTSDPIHPDFSWFRVSEETKADFLVRALRFAHDNDAPWIGVMVVWNIAAPFWTQQNEEFWWSITNPDGTLRPAHNAIKGARENGVLP